MSLLNKYTLPAERERNCRFAERFVNASEVIENGGAITGTPTINNGIVLDGTNDYVSYNNVIKDFSAFSIVIEFTPDFAYDEAADRYFFGTTGNYFRIIRLSGGNLFIEMGDGTIGSISGATYSAYWKQNEKNILVLTSVSTDTSIWLNGHQIMTDDNSGWGSNTSITDLEIGTSGSSPGTSNFDGTIYDVKIFNTQLTDQEALDYSNGGGFLNYENEANNYWPLDYSNYDPTNTKCLDVMGNNDMTIVTATKNTDEPGFYFDGNDHMYSDAISVGTNDFTAIAMVKDSEGTGVGFDGILAENGGGAAGEIMPLYLTSGTGALRLNIDGTAYTTGDSISDGQWHVVGVSADRDENALFFIDGKQTGTAQDISAKSSVNVSFSIPQIGKTGAATNIVGDIAHVYFWNDRALTPIQVADLTGKLFRRINDL